MFFLTFSSLWSFSYFFFLTYAILVFSILIYIIAVQGRSSSTSSLSFVKNNFVYVNTFDLFQFLLSIPLLFILLNFLWVSPTVTSWFGHIIFSNFTSKFFYIISLLYVIALVVYINSSYFTSQEFLDYITVVYNFYYWMLVLYFSNSIFTSIFVIEILSTLIFLLIITSSYSSNYYYSNLDFSNFNYKDYVFPFATLQSILFFFWISLIASLLLFLFLLFFYIKVLTFDWFLTEYVFIYFVNSKSYSDIISFGLVWFIFLLCVFIKCGLTPFFIWKPTFFKGLPTNMLFFYVCFYYMFLFLFLINLLLNCFNEIFLYFFLIQIFMVFIALFFLLFILCETFYIKSFLAMSSILNSVLVLLALNSTHTIDFLFWL